MRIVNQTKGTQLASHARVARSYPSRIVGLLGKASMPRGEALVIDPCTSIHTAFMRFPIDVLYVDPGRRVVKAVAGLKPFRFSAVWSGKCSVIELPAGSIITTNTTRGDQLAFDSERPAPLT